MKLRDCMPNMEAKRPNTTNRNCGKEKYRWNWKTIQSAEEWTAEGRNLKNVRSKGEMKGKIIEAFYQPILKEKLMETKQKVNWYYR